MSERNPGPYAALRSAGVILLAVLLLAAVFGLVFAATGLNVAENVLLPLVAIAGVVLLLAVLALVAAVFGTLGLDDSKQPLGLPEGSIRAVIALALVVLFAILSIYLFDKISDSQAQISSEAKDLAKQLLTIIGTLMTAVAGFYFGAQSAATSKDFPSADGRVAPAPQLQNVLPSSESLQNLIATNKPLDLTITGANLNVVKECKLVDPKTGKQIIATHVTSNNNEVMCQLPVDQNAPVGAWDVIVSDSGTNSATLKGKFTLNP